MMNRKAKVNLNDREYALLQKKADDLGISKAEFLRRHINATETACTETFDKIKKVTEDVNEIGTYINQIAKKANECGVNSNDIHCVKIYMQELIKLVDSLKN